ncbi:hypothetical protein C8R46DRAFT_290729 [Mycena filopes]|nr:hypothetical protein C8R46DRAFT_290729 [Mycena filopes]
MGPTHRPTIVGQDFNAQSQETCFRTNEGSRTHCNDSDSDNTRLPPYLSSQRSLFPTSTMAMDDGTALLPLRTAHRIRTHLRTTLLVLNCLLLALPAALLLFDWGLLPDPNPDSVCALAGAAALGLAVCFLLCFLSAWMGLTPPAAEAWALAGTGCAALGE